MKNKLVALVATTFLLAACSSDTKPTKAPVKPRPEVKVPSFNADSAYNFIDAQVAFGPRVPNSMGHKACGDYLQQTLERFTDTVYVQEGTVKRFDMQEMNFRNFVGSINPKASSRVLLVAHWDTRFTSDQEEGVDVAILGANDGGSGVGVLLEVARQMSISKPSVGVDILLLDVEDQGQPSDSELNQVRNSWCLGSQYWARNPHVSNYYAKYGILLDMVGGLNAKFKQEGISRAYASSIVDKVWNEAQNAGYSSYFLFQEAPEIVDDHLYINGLANIPTIDIIENDQSTEYFFNKHWHTTKDDMSNISKPTLKAVGQTLLEVVYREQ
ncbi:MAG: glutaminyl-peptide cyclotransferase [Candidatus Azotimanducaceae bacterium]|jgi:glutaminyl-peptide cyclotransferase